MINAKPVLSSLKELFIFRKVVLSADSLLHPIERLLQQRQIARLAEFLARSYPPTSSRAR
jgi:hypothetical protein